VRQRIPGHGAAALHRSAQKQGICRAMASKVLLALVVFVFLVDGHLPGMRELRNPDTEGGKGASRASLLSKRSEA